MGEDNRCLSIWYINAAINTTEKGIRGEISQGARKEINIA